MTLVIGKFRINLELGTLLGLLVSTIATTASITWAISGYKTSQEEKAKETNAKLDRVIAWQNQHGAADSVLKIRVDSVYAWDGKKVPELNAMRSDISVLMKRMGVMHTSVGYLISHRDKNGHTTFEDVKN